MNRPADCPRPDDLLLDELGELPVNRSVGLRAHVDGCRACQHARAVVQRLTAELGNPPAAAAESEAFVARVEGAIRALGRPAPAVDPGAWWTRRRVTVLAGAAAALILVPTAARLALRSPAGSAGDGSAPVAGTLAARGSPNHEGRRLGADVWLVQGGRLQPLGTGQAVGEADTLAVEVTNLSGRATYVMAFACDAAGDVHWLYPGYTDAATNPASVAIADGVKARVLDEVVQLVAPAAGPIRFVTLLSPTPLNVKEVEARVASGKRSDGLAPLFPGAVVREWNARWEPR
jgi:hypothetical protein